MKGLALIAFAAILAAALIGCQMSAPYVMETDRTDQKMEAGNRGYLKGTPPPAEDRAGLKRPWLAVDVDLPGTEEGKAQEAGTKTVEVREEISIVRSQTPAGTTVQKKVVIEEEVK